MINLKFVCLSDIHLGADYSILTNTDASSPTPNATLSSLAAALGTTVRDVTAGSTVKPQLLLLGDILDLGMSPVGRTAAAFQQFLGALFPKGLPSALSSEVVYVPGNHDHNVWRWAEDELYARSFTGIGTPAKDPEPVTKLFAKIGQDDGDLVQSPLLCRLLQAASGNMSARVRLAYPNYAVATSDRCVVFHHGHFIESTYRMMSDLRRLLSLGGGPVTKVAELERENSAWIDFVWSSLGESGLVGEDADSLYLRLQDGAATEQLVHRLSRRLVHHFQRLLPMSGEREVQIWAHRAADAFLDLTVERMGETERNSYETVLGADSIHGLSWYLDVPLANQFRAEIKKVPDDTVFIFGHTHKPFEDALTPSSYLRPVRIFNTGGWVLDEPTMASLEGAAMVLVDDQMNVVSLRLFNQNPNGDPAPVGVSDSAAYPPGNPLLTAVRTALAASDTKQNWAKFTAAAGKALRDRQSSVIARYDLSSSRGSRKPGRAALRKVAR